jgi:pimeloyl-ACP methyl ester carboxylesterase
MPFLRRNNVALYCEKIEGEAPAVVLIHGWCCDHTYFAPQIEHFKRLGHTIIVLDLRGHGRSDKPHQSYTMQVFADDVAWLCGELGVSKPIMIGHSMGGIVAFDLAARYPDLPSTIVMLDAAVALPTASRAAVLQALDRLRGPDYVTALRNLVAALFLPTDDVVRKARILESMVASPQHVMVAAYEGLADFDPSEAQGRLVAPALYIAADELSPRSDIGRLRELIPQMAYGQTVGSGHFCQLEVPDQINAMIDRYLAVTPAVSAPSLRRKNT